MEKIFSTQLNGRFQKIDEQAFDIEDGARLLAQAIIGEGSIYIFPEEELEGVFLQAKHGQDSLANVELLTEEKLPTLSTADRVLILTKNSQSEKIIEIGSVLRSMQVGFVVIGSTDSKIENPIEDLAHAYIDLHLHKGLVPTDSGGRTGYPHLLAALYVYHHMKLIIDEMVEDIL